MDYLTVADAKSLSGLRLSLTAGVPGPWGESAKALFKIRQVPYSPVLQKAADGNEELVAWTGQRNAPTAMLDDEPPRSTPVDMINLAERLGSGASLLPSSICERVSALGIVNEIAGENGLGWTARYLMLAGAASHMTAEQIASNPLMKDYRYDADAAAGAPVRIVEILKFLDQQLDGKGFLIGESLSVADVYWACFSQMLNPLPADVNPMPDYMRAAWGPLQEAVNEIYEVPEALFALRDRVFEQHIGLPLDY